MSASDSGLPMKASDQLRSDAVLIEEAWKKQRMLDIADEVAKLEAEIDVLREVIQLELGMETPDIDALLTGVDDE